LPLVRRARPVRSPPARRLSLAQTLAFAVGHAREYLTAKEELLLAPQVLEKTSFFRRAIANLKPEDAAETVLSRMGKTSTNEEFLRLLNL